MEKIVFGGAVLSMIIVTVTFIVSLCIFIWKWIADDFRTGYKKAIESD
jgi:hypothetical protein